MSEPLKPVRLHHPIVLGLSLLLVLLPVAVDAAPAGTAAAPSAAKGTKPPAVTAAPTAPAVALPAEAASPDSSHPAATPIYRKKGVLIGAAAALVGVLALVLGSGSGGGERPPDDTELPGFPPPPSFLP